jgi:hypothetical protein
MTVSDIIVAHLKVINVSVRDSKLSNFMIR